MIEKIKNYIKNDRVSTSRIDVIDGIRVIAILLIAWFHIWQQSWLWPVIKIGNFSMDFVVLPRAGYLWVDMFILLSAFQLFLPHARQMVYGSKTTGAIEFYKKRMKRILPSYLLCIIICLYFAVFSDAYPTLVDLLKDLFAHLTFTHNFWADTYLWTKLNTVLWTVAVLVQFYFIFPFLAKAFKKFSSLTFLIMCAIGIGFRVLFVNSATNPALLINQMPAFLDVFAIGMFGAYIFVIINEKVKYQRLSIISTVVSLGSLVLIYIAMKDLASISGYENLQRWQGINRTWVALIFLLFIVSSAYSMKWYRSIYSNKLMVFLASISFNFYIWHQYIAVKLRQWNIPYSEYASPNMYGDKKWQWLYTISCFAISIIFSWLVTWLYEKKLITKLITSKTTPTTKVPNKHHGRRN